MVGRSMSLTWPCKGDVGGREAAVFGSRIPNPVNLGVMTWVVNFLFGGFDAWCVIVIRTKESLMRADQVA